MRAVEQQRSDLPHDSDHPLYPYGFGLHYVATRLETEPQPIR